MTKEHIKTTRISVCLTTGELVEIPLDKVARTHDGNFILDVKAVMEQLNMIQDEFKEKVKGISTVYQRVLERKEDVHGISR